MESRCAALRLSCPSSPLFTGLGPGAQGEENFLAFACGLQGATTELLEKTNHHPELEVVTIFNLVFMETTFLLCSCFSGFYNIQLNHKMIVNEYEWHKQVWGINAADSWSVYSPAGEWKEGPAETRRRLCP